MNKNNIKKKAVFQIYLIISLIFVFLIQLNIVNAVDAPTGCCVKLKDDANYCANEVTEDVCEAGYFSLGQNCQAIAECQAGCCDLSSSENSCVTNAPKAACQNNWISDPQCRVQQCQPQCCVYGNNFGMLTSQECSNRNGEIILSATDNQQCFNEFNIKQDVKGCCTTSCSYTAVDQCGSSDDFILGEQCVNTVACKEQCDTNIKTSCSENLDFFNKIDNCNNIIEKVNCDFPDELCVVNDGIASCQSSQCLDTWNNPVVEGDGVNRENQDSWCEYQSATGFGRDLPGTNHYLHKCVNGKEIAQTSLQPDRGQICTYGDFSIQGLIEDKTLAQFIDNSGAANCGLCNVNTKYKIKIKDYKVIAKQLSPTRAECCAQNNACRYVSAQGSTGAVADTLMEVLVYITPSLANLNDNKEDKAVAFLITDSDQKPVQEIPKSQWIASGREFSDYFLNLDIPLQPYEIKFNLPDGNYEFYYLNGDDAQLMGNQKVSLGLSDNGFCVPIVPLSQIGKKYDENYDLNSQCRIAFSNPEDESGNKYVIKGATSWAKIVTKPWKCKTGCSFYDDNFMKGTNFVCNTFGDCGADYNVVGEFSSRGYNRYCEGGGNIGSQCKSEDEQTLKKNNFGLNFDDFTNAGKGLFAGDITITSEQIQSVFEVGYEFDFYTTLIADLLKGSIGLHTLFLLPFLPFSFLIDVVTGIAKLVGITKTERRDVGFLCNAWTPPIGGNNCWKCSAAINKDINGDSCDPSLGTCGLLPVDKSGNVIEGYKCEPNMCASLGSFCQFEADTETGSNCFAEQELAISDPWIKVKKDLTTFQCEVGSCNIEIIEGGNRPDNGFKVNGKIKPRTDVNITLETFDPATGNSMLTKECKYGEGVFSIIENFGSEELSTQHRLDLSPKDLVSGEINKFYVTCTNRNQITTEVPYVIELEVGSEPDSSKPIINSLLPETGLIPFNVSEIDVNINVYDSGGLDMNGCRFTDKRDDVFENMGTMECSRSGASQSYYDCSASVDINETTKLWFMCEDENGNRQDNVYPSEGFNLRQTDELRIDNIECPHFGSSLCQGTIYETPLNIKLRTAGGVDGSASCSWKLNDNPSQVFFSDFSSDLLNVEHNQGNINLFDGLNDFEFVCRDSVGNTVIKHVSFNFERDEQAPKVIRVYQEGNVLSLLVNEFSSCIYTKNDNLDSIDVQTFEMEKDSNGKTHRLIVDKEGYFNIVCKDNFENSFKPLRVYLIKE